MFTDLLLDLAKFEHFGLLYIPLHTFKLFFIEIQS